MNSQTRFLNLLNFQGNSNGKRGVAAILRYALLKSAHRAFKTSLVIRVYGGGD